MDSKILIYTMGKVASTSMRCSLNKLGFETFNAHTLNPKINEDIEKGIEVESGYVEKPLLDHHKSVYKYIQDNPETKWKVICLVRDPVAKNVSTFFQVIDRVCPEYKNKQLKNLNVPFFKGIDHEKVLNWLDEELKVLTGLDVIEHGLFDKQKGYSVYQNEKFEVVVIKYEKLKECIVEVMKGLLNIENFELLKENTSHNKIYAPEYYVFKEYFDFGDEYIEKMYNSKYMKTFYTEKEIEQFKKRWKHEN